MERFFVDDCRLRSSATFKLRHYLPLLSLPAALVQTVDREAGAAGQGRFIVPLIGIRISGATLPRPKIFPPIV